MNYEPNILKGNVLELLPGVLEAVDPDTIPIVYHSFVLYQFSTDQQKEVFDMLNHFGREHTLYRVAIEWMGTETPFIKLDIWEGGNHKEIELARCNPHGRWIEWKAGSTLTPY